MIIIVIKRSIIVGKSSINLYYITYPSTIRKQKLTNIMEKKEQGVY